MLANERLIYKFSLEQKIKLITSLNLYENSPCENYGFPVFGITRTPLKGSTGIFATQFPSDKALASSWNAPLVSEVYSRHGEEVYAVKPYSYFNVSDDNAAEDVSEDFFLSAKILAAKIKGLNRAKQFVNFEEIPKEGEDAQKRTLKDVIFTDSAPSSVFVKLPENIEGYKKEWNGKLFYGVAGNMEAALNCFLKGCTLVFLKTDFTEELISRLERLTSGYRAAYAAYRADEITLTELDRRVQAFEIFDENILDTACDNLISVLLEMRAISKQPAPSKSGISFNRPAVFDEVAGDVLSLTAARQSAVLLKNGGVLPLSDTVKVAVLGEYTKDINYQKDFYNGSATCERTPFNLINNYEINAVGFASGYARGESGRQDLIDIATGLAKDAELALVYLCAEKGEKSLPAGQTELIDALYAKSVKIIAVVSSDGAIDCTFAGKCAAVLLTHRLGQGEPSAVLDILKGLATPSGRLAETFYYKAETDKPYYLATPNEVRYPFGYGLSYTQFEYKNLKINERGISCTVKNTGNADGFAVPQFYLQKPLSDGLFQNKLLRGFKKVYIKKGDAVRVEIPFDTNTFKVFDAKTGLYRIEGGVYTVTVGENFSDTRLTGTVTLSEYVYKDGFENETAEEVAPADGVKFDVNQEPPEVKKAKKQLPFGIKLFVAIIFVLYFEGLMAALAFTDIVHDKGILFYSVIGAFAAVFLALFITYVALISKKRKKQHYVPVNDVLTDLVENVKEFNEIAKVTYAQPVKEEPEEELPEKTDGLPEAEAVEEKEETYELAFTETDGKEVSGQITFNEICTSFQTYALSLGVQVDIASVRALVAAISASKIVVVTAKNAEVLPDFLSAISGYFGSGNVTVAGENWKLSDLLWKREEDKFVVSDFINAVYSATKSPEKLCAAVISGVKADSLSSWFAPFIKYANHPTEEHILTLNDDLSFRLPDNFVYVLSPEEEGTFPREFADACLQIDLAILRAEKGAETETPSIPKAGLADLVKEAREGYFMSERVWKKLDELFETVRAGEKFRLGNKNTLQLEKFTSVILECGGDEAECITGVFLSKIVPLLKLTRMYSADGGEKTLFGVIEKLFNEEELTKIQRALTKAVTNG